MARNSLTSYFHPKSKPTPPLVLKKKPASDLIIYIYFFSFSLPIFRDLVQDMPHFVKVVWLPKSTGVIARPTEERIGTRLQKIREYFYGALNNLEPYNIGM